MLLRYQCLRRSFASALLQGGYVGINVVIIGPLVALLSGIAILIWPRLLID